MHRYSLSAAWPLVLALGLSACRPSTTTPPATAAPEELARKLRVHVQEHPEDRAAQLDLALLQWAWLGERAQARDQMTALSEHGDLDASLVRLIMAEGELDTGEIQRQAYRMISQLAALGGQADARAVAAVEFAARHLTAVDGDPEETDRFVAFYESLDLSALPYVVRQPLVSYRAAVARRNGEPYRDYFRQEGCVQDWQATEVLGNLGASELGQHPDAVYEADPKARVVALACATRLWNPTPRAGVRRLRSYLRATDAPLLLDLDTEHPSIASLDGVPLMRSDHVDHFAPRQRRMALDVEPGWHVLEVETTVPKERSWILIRAATPDGQPIEVRSAPPEDRANAFAGTPRTLEPVFLPPLQGVRAGPGRPAWIDEPLRDFMALDRALATRRSDDAELVARRLAHDEHFAEGQLLRARFERADPSRPQTISAAREQRALQSAIALAPELDAARVRWLELMLGRGETDEVAASLEEAPASALRSVSGELFRFQAQRAKGNEHLALEALERARALAPRHCGVLSADLTVARERDDVRLEDDRVAQMARCGGTLSLRANLAEKRGRQGDAIALWKEALARVPDDTQALENLARLTEASGDIDEARGYWSRILAYNPLRAAAGVRMADLAHVQGKIDEARSWMQDILQRHPQSDTLRASAETLGIEDDLLAYRVDGLDVLREYMDSGVQYEGVSEVLVLDRSVARVYANGGQRHIVHLLVQLLNKDALDRYGEVEVPPQARLLTLRSIKPDGKILEPEVVSGKEGVELRHLEVGDFVDYEFIVEQPPATELGAYVDVTGFRFQSLDIPYHRTELYVVFPSALPMKVDARRGAPDATVQTVQAGGEELTVWHFRSDEVPRLGVEAGHRPLLDEVPNVRVYSQPEIDPWLQRIAATLLPAQRSNPALRRLARSLVRGHETPRERFEALWHWVVESIEDSGDLTTPATVTLAGRRGNRMMLLYAMAKSVGLSTEIWLVRDTHGPRPLEGGHPMFEAFDTPVLAVDVGEGSPLLAMTASKVMPLGYLPPGYAEAEALRLPLGETPPSVDTRTPALSPELADGRHWTLAFTVRADGSAQIQGRLALRGMEAISWRQALRDIDRDRVEELFNATELGWLRGATLEQLKIAHEEDLRQALVLEFKASAEGVAIRQSDALVMRSAPVPLNLAQRYTGLTERKTGLVMPYAPMQTVDMRVTLDGARFDDVPQPIEVSSEWGSFVRRVEAQTAEVRLRYQSKLRTGVVEASRYPGLAEFARRVEVATQAPLRAIPARTARPSTAE